MGGWEALGGINDALGIEWQTGNYFLMIKSTLPEFFEKFFLDLFLQFDVCGWFAHMHVCVPLACLLPMEAGGGLFGEMALLSQNKGVSAACHTRATDGSLGWSL